MGRLRDFLGYVSDRARLMASIEQRLCQLQAKYETYFSEVSRVRESELGQLTEHILVERGRLPGWLEQALDQAQAQVETELEEKLLATRRRIAELRQQAEEKRQASVEQEDLIHRKNSALDTQEETLKERNQLLLAKIADFNGRIRELGKGFGFFANLFRMRELGRQREELDREQADVAANIEVLRSRWSEAEAEHQGLEAQLRQHWVAFNTEAAGLQARLDYLEAARSELILRGTIERVLFERVKEPRAAGAGDPACPRCQAPNPSENHFCQICAQRLHADRPDLAGSLDELGELNLHHRRFAQGMQAGQQLIGLVRGVKSGLQAFSASVSSLIDSENRYPLPQLMIDVPVDSIDYGRGFDQLHAYVKQDLSLHPKVFAEQVQPLLRDLLSEAKIKAYFERMGEELSRQASAQW